MKYDPHLIILKVLSRYMESEIHKQMLNELGKHKNIGPKKLRTIVSKYFDWERLIYHPLIYQDIWIYNYLFIECSNRLRRDGLISKYEREAFIFDDKEFSKIKDHINNR